MIVANLVMLSVTRLRTAIRMLEDQRRLLVELLDVLVETTIRSESGIPYCDWSRSSIEAPQTSSATLRTVEVVPEGFIGVGIEVVEDDGRLKGLRPRRCVLPSNRQGYESYGGSYRHFAIGHRAARTALARPATRAGGGRTGAGGAPAPGRAGSCRSTETPVLARPRCWSVRSRSDSASGSSAPPGREEDGPVYTALQQLCSPPTVGDDARRDLQNAKSQLESEAPEGVAPGQFEAREMRAPVGTPAKTEG